MFIVLCFILIGLYFGFNGLHMRPSSIPILTREKKLYKVQSNYTGLERVACPHGTVPIRRITKDDLIREKIHSKKYDNYSILTTEINPGTHYTVVRTKFDPKKKYNGVGASLYTYTQPAVLPSEYSSSRIKIQNGDENIQVGWTVNPTLYGDKHMRYYIYFNGRQPGCFNVRCPGFVIVNHDVPLDSVVDEVQYVPSFIYKDTKSSNWWFAITSSGINIGFWPAPLFNSLTGSGTNVDWEGEVYSPPDLPSPPMGFGRFPSTFVPPEYNAWNADLVIINEVNQMVDATNTEGYRDNKKYGVVDAGYSERKKWSRYGMFYGGPGGAKRNY